MNKAEKIDLAISKASIIYIDELRRSVEYFSNKTFSISNSWKINKKAFGKDMLRAPANAIWTPFHFIATNIGKKTKSLNISSLESSCEKLINLSPGFSTDTEKEIEWIIYTEFLKIPFKQGERESVSNRLMEIILDQEEIKEIMMNDLSRIAESGMTEEGIEKITNKILEYVDNRKAASEVSATIIGAATAFAGTKSINLGAISLGQTLASTAAYHSAVSSFALGNTIGGIFYSIVPISTSAGAVIISTGGVAAILGVISAFGGIITDPIQNKLGLHKKKLNILIDSIESQLIKNEDKKMELKDGYAARILDLVDMISSLAIKN